MIRKIFSTIFDGLQKNSTSPEAKIIFSVAASGLFRGSPFEEYSAEFTMAYLNAIKMLVEGER